MSRRLKRGLTRREFLAAAGKAGAVAALAGHTTFITSRAIAEGVFTEAERATLRAAVAQIIPASGPEDWSAADLGAHEYIEKLLAGTADIYAGGPYRDNFANFQPLGRVKEMGWANEIARMRTIYKEGIADLDRRADGSYASAPTHTQESILRQLDVEGSLFFAALYNHTMEGVYAHPVYGGNKDYRAWNDLCYEGDVHGVRRPGIGDPASSWNVHGGYAPEEMESPGECP